MSNELETLLVFTDEGEVTCLWTDAIPLQELGKCEVTRASTVEFNGETGEWDVRWAGDESKVVYSNPDRGACIAWEHREFNLKLAA